MDVRSLTDYYVSYTLGSGGFAKVYNAMHKSTGIKVAIKQIAKKNYPPEEMEHKIKKEIELMSIADHPFIASLFDTIENPGYQYLIL